MYEEINNRHPNIPLDLEGKYKDVKRPESIFNHIFTDVRPQKSKSEVVIDQMNDQMNPKDSKDSLDSLDSTDFDIFSSPTKSNLEVPKQILKSNVFINPFNKVVFQLVKLIENKIMSPYGLKLALYMIMNASNDAELFKFLLMTNPINKINTVVGKELAMFQKFEDIKIAHSLWVNPMYILTPEYVKVLNLYYGANVELITNVDNINNWCKIKSKGLINRIISNVSQQTIIMIINLMCFRFRFSNQCRINPSMTMENYFYGTKGKQICRMIFQSSKLNYSNISSIQAVEIPHLNPMFSCIIIMGSDMFRIDDLNEIGLDTIIGSFQITDVNLYLPRMKLVNTIDFKDTLIKSGISKIFQHNHPFKIDGILQKVIVEFDEHTEYEEKTITNTINNIKIIENKIDNKIIDNQIIDNKMIDNKMIDNTIIGNQNSISMISMRVDKPFILIIRYVLTNNILFIAKINNI